MYLEYVERRRVEKVKRNETEEPSRFMDPWHAPQVPEWRPTIPVVDEVNQG